MVSSPKHSYKSIELAVLSVQLLKGCGDDQCINRYCASSSCFEQQYQKASGDTSQDVVDRAKYLLTNVGIHTICKLSIRRILLMWKQGVIRVVRDFNVPDVFVTSVFPIKPFNHLLWSVDFQEPSSSTRGFLEKYKGSLFLYPRHVLNQLFDLRKLSDLIVDLCCGCGNLDGITHFFLDHSLTFHDAYLNYKLFIEIILLQYDSCEDPIPILNFINCITDLINSGLTAIQVKPSLVFSDAQLFWVLLLLYSPERFINLGNNLLISLANTISTLRRNPDIYLRLLIKLRMTLNSLPLDTSIFLMESWIRMCNRAITDHLQTVLRKKPDAFIAGKDSYVFRNNVQFSTQIGVGHYNIHPIDDPLFWSQTPQTKYYYDISKVTLADLQDSTQIVTSLCELSNLFYLCNNLTTAIFPPISSLQPMSQFLDTLNITTVPVCYLNSLFNYNYFSPQMYSPVIDELFLEESVIEAIIEHLFAISTQSNPEFVLSAALNETAHIENVPIVSNELFHNSFLCSSSYDWQIDAQYKAIMFDPYYDALKDNSTYSKIMGRAYPYLLSSLRDVNDDIVTANLDLDVTTIDYLLNYVITSQKGNLGPYCFQILRKNNTPTAPSKRIIHHQLINGSIISVPTNTSTLKSATSLNESVHARLLETLQNAIPRDQRRVTKGNDAVMNQLTERTGFTFCNYPFLLNARTKHLLLRYEIGYMIRVTKQLPFLIFTAERKTLVGDFLAYITSFSTEDLSYEWLSPAHRLILRRMLRVQFLGEAALDFGGPSRELFNEILPAFIKEHIHYFNYNRDTRYYYINWRRIRDCTDHDPYLLTTLEYPLTQSQKQYLYEVRNFFCQLGMIMGVALINMVTVSSVFPRVFYKLLLGGSYTSVTGADLREVDPDLYHSLINLCKCEREEREVLTLDFDGLGPVLTELVVEEMQRLENGAYKNLCEIPHFSEYLVANDFPINSILFHLKQLVRDKRHALTYPYEVENWSVDQQTLPLFIRLKQLSVIYNQKIIEFIRVGFLSVTKARLLSLFSAADLELALTGEADLNFMLLEQYAVYEKPYTPEHPNVKNFWMIVAELTKQQQRKLLQFITGSDRVPAGGLQHIGLKIIPNGTDDTRLPSAHTCFSILCLPAYSSLEKLRERLFYAIENCNDFGLT